MLIITLKRPVNAKFGVALGARVELKATLSGKRFLVQHPDAPNLYVMVDSENVEIIHREE